MGITVNSPHSGNPVKVRDEDVGRAVRDEEGRIFYVLPRSDGKGYYGAVTRAPNTRDEARALQMENKIAVARGSTQEQVEVAREPVRTRRGGGRFIAALVLLAILAALAWALSVGPLAEWRRSLMGSPTPAAPATPPASPAPQSDAGGAWRLAA
jgi:hypothetical protein